MPVTHNFPSSERVVCQVKAIFWPVTKGPGRKSEFFQTPLAYVEFFKPGRAAKAEQNDGSTAHVPDDHNELYRVVRDLGKDGLCKGAVVRLSAISRPSPYPESSESLLELTAYAS